MTSLKALNLDAPATGCGFAGNALAVADGDGNVHFCCFDDQVFSRKLHDGAILCVDTDPKSGAVVTGGDDGKVWRTKLDEEPELLLDGRKWVDAVAVSERGHTAFAAGKTITILRKGHDASNEVTAPSSIGGLAFSADGKWLGAAVYGGALLVQLSDPSKTKMLEWQGSHQSIAFSPDGRFCVTSMLENALHVWRIDKPEEKHGRMGGYPAKPLSFAWTADGRYLATAGAEVLVMWPFLTADGPIGQSAGVASPEGQRIVRSVASRPQSLEIACGFADGAVALYHRKDQTFRFIAAESDKGTVNQIVISADGKRLGFVREMGGAGLALLD